MDAFLSYLKQKRDWLTILFYALYICVAGATFRHTMHGFASLEGGSLVWGALSALALDAGMMLSASGLRKRRSYPLVTGLVVSAIASTYTQLLYSVSIAAQVPVADGATWLDDIARMIIDARVILLPALLPALSVIYAFAAKGQETQSASELDVLSTQVEQLKAQLNQRSQLQGQVDAILAQKLSKLDTAREVWQLSGNGTGVLTAQEVANFAKCSLTTARNAQNDE